MGKGRSLHIGLNSLDPTHYGTDGRLRAAENDALSMKGIAISQGFEPTILLTRDATSSNVLQSLAKAAAELDAEDTFLLSYAGHGSQVPDVNGDEEDGRDETWCLFDRMLVDDELRSCWTSFKPGVRILMLSDSCHSGTVSRALYMALQNFQPARDLLEGVVRPVGSADPFEESNPFLPRVLPLDIALKVFERNKSLYEGIQWGCIGRGLADVRATVLLLSGCQDNQTSGDGISNGLFTAALLSVWNSGAFRGTYRDFQRQIVKALGTPFQSPNYDVSGASNPGFEAETPFSLSSRPREQGLSERVKQHMDPEQGDPDRDRSGPRQAWTDRCTLDLAFPQSRVTGMSTQELTDFFHGECADLAQESFQNACALAREVAGRGLLPRGGEAGASCHMDHEGRVSCDAHVSVHF